MPVVASAPAADATSAPISSATSTARADGRRPTTTSLYAAKFAESRLEEPAAASSTVRSLPFRAPHADVQRPWCRRVDGRDLSVARQTEANLERPYDKQTYKQGRKKSR